MSFFGNFLAPIYVGMANGRFVQKQYNKAIYLYNKASKLDQRLMQNEHILSCIGRCYLALKKYSDAVENLSKSFELYKKIEKELKDTQKEEFKNMLEAYNIALQSTGQNEKAIEIKEKIKLL